MKKLVIILIIGVIIVIASILGLFAYMQSTNDNPGEETGDETVDTMVNKSIEEVKQDTIFYKIKNCVDSYMIKINDIATQDEENSEYDIYVSEEEKGDAAQSMIDIFGKEYVQEFNITKENIAEKFKERTKVFSNYHFAYL